MPGRGILRSLRSANSLMLGTAQLLTWRILRSNERYWMTKMRIAGRRAETDMWRDPGEQFYGRLYLEAVRGELSAKPRLRILDVGCQSGRLAIPLAMDGHDVTGVDISAEWLDACKRHCDADGVEVDLICGDVASVINMFPAGHFDVLLCTELLYTARNAETILRGLAGVVNRGGLVITSHRTKFYLMSTLVRYRMFEEAARLADFSEGEVLGAYYNWFTEAELGEMYNRAGLSITNTIGIGVVSGIGVDGLASLVSPSQLNPKERSGLLSLERQLGRDSKATARYLLVVARPR